MKKTFLTLALAALLITPASLSWAQFTGKGSTGGYSGPTAQPTTVADAVKTPDDTWVALTGKIEKHLGGDHYLFTDKTGSVTIDIDDDKWRGTTAGPDDMVEIRGEVDQKKGGRVEIDVEFITKK